MSDTLIWIAIFVCITQSAALSGLNIALFSISRLRLESAAHGGDERAKRVLALRKNANWTLATILWGNVGVNVLLTLLADSLLAGALAFIFSTVVITFAGEIIPQAWFTRRALKVASLLTPLLHFYRIVLAPIAWPVGWVLDRTVGPETIPWFSEEELRAILRHHARVGETEVGRVEAVGAINFLALDDLPVSYEGEIIDPASIISVPFTGNEPQLPLRCATVDDPFLQRIAASGRKWIVLTDPGGTPRRVLNAHLYLRRALFGPAGLPNIDADELCYRPLIVRDPELPLGLVLGRLTVSAEHAEDDVIDRDIILVWTDDERRIITGSDLLGRLLRGIVRSESRRASVR